MCKLSLVGDTLNLDVLRAFFPEFSFRGYRALRAQGHPLGRGMRWAFAISLLFTLRLLFYREASGF